MIVGLIDDLLVLLYLLLNCPFEELPREQLGRAGAGTRRRSSGDPCGAGAGTTVRSDGAPGGRGAEAPDAGSKGPDAGSEGPDVPEAASGLP